MAKRKRLPCNQAQEVVVESPQVQPGSRPRRKLKRLRGWRTSIGWNAGLRLELRRKIGFGPRRSSGCGVGNWNRGGITGCNAGKGSGVAAGREGQRPASISPAIMM